MILAFSRMLGLCLLILCHFSVLSQRINPISLVESIDIDSAKNMLSWTDRQGYHIVMMETFDERSGEEPDTQSSWVYITHELQTESRRNQTWTYQSGEYDCPVDVYAGFRAAPTFSDLNEDGVYEIWFIIEKSCKGDISPSQLEILMVDENGKQYLAQGETLLHFPDGNIDGGAYDVGDFDRLPQIYRDFAENYFLQNSQNYF